MNDSTDSEGRIMLEDFKVVHRMGKGIWVVETDELYPYNHRIVTQVTPDLKRIFPSRSCRNFIPLDCPLDMIQMNGWECKSQLFSMEFECEGEQGGSSSSLGIYHVDIGEILPRPQEFEFDPELHMMPKDIMHLSPTLLLLDHNRLLEIRGDHVKFCALPFKLTGDVQINVDQANKRALIATRLIDQGLRAVLLDYENGLILQEVKY